VTLVFVHGSGCTHHVWSYQTSFFNNSIALDFPGHPNGNALTDIEAMSQWLLSVLEERNLHDVVLVGHSLGSAVVLKAALDTATSKTESHRVATSENSRIKGLVLIGAGAKLKVMPQFLDALTSVVEKGEEFPDFLLAPNQTLAEPLRTDVNTAMVKNGAAVTLIDFLICNSFDVMGSLHKVSLPVQLIVGSEDVMTPVKYSHYLNEQLPNASLNIIDGATHMVFAEQPDIVNQCIESFIANLD
jgi:pimeloyl-ACP methyl ester carboxylesterase